ncbi:hypothetical protein BDZ45DRAFT_658388 [Acephala macrosclerotiorum]|nr:hypothetical protein BDZ45DRAFT_658388 [Acephala macrosclerotiorum]
MKMAASPSPMVADTMERLSSKAGVLATLAIDRTSSTLLSFKGTLSTLLVSSQGTASAPNANSVAVRSPTTTGPASTITAASNGNSVGDAVSISSAEQGIDEFVRMIWGYVNTTGQLVADMDPDDDLKLLRLRTKKHELVIFPDSKFIFVVVHDVKSS